MNCEDSDCIFCGKHSIPLFAAQCSGGNRGLQAMNVAGVAATQSQAQIQRGIANDPSLAKLDAALADYDGYAVAYAEGLADGRREGVALTLLAVSIGAMVIAGVAFCYAMKYCI